MNAREFNGELPGIDVNIAFQMESIRQNVLHLRNENKIDA